MTDDEPSAEVSVLVDNLFRREHGRIVSTLTRVFGVENLDLAEDVVQDALLKALRQWRYGKVPRNPSAWITQVAKNRALDLLRRDKVFRARQPGIAESFTSENAESFFLDDEVRDDQLRMMFASSHPSLPRESQVALTLKTLCGFGIPEIARAFLTGDDAIAKRLVRAKQKLREDRVKFEIPAGEDLTDRLDAVLQTIYLLFNEGYNASQGEDLIRRDLCDEAIRLAKLLVGHPAGNTPQTHALLALMLLHAARLPARMDDHGNLLLLREQDRSLWDAGMIAEGLSHLEQSAAGNQATRFHLEAGIAACHSLAPDYDQTDWPRILELYDLLVTINDSPVVALNRAIAIAKTRGAKAGLEAVRQIPNRNRLDSYYLLHAALAEFHCNLGDHAAAACEYRRALKLTENLSERAFLERQIAKLW